MSSDNASAAGEEPYRFISDLVAVLDDDSYPGIVWNEEGTHFKFTKGVLDAPGGGLTLLVDSDDIGALVRQLNNFKIYMDKRTRWYHHEHLYRGAPPEVLALIIRSKTGPGARAATAHGQSGPRRKTRRRTGFSHPDDDWSQEGDGDEELYVPRQTHSRPRGGGGQSPTSAGAGVYRRGGGGGVAAAASAAAANHAADVSALEAQAVALSAELASARQALASTQASLQLVTRLMHRLGGKVGWGFAQTAPGASGIAGVDLRDPDAAAGPGEVKLANEDALVAAVGRLGAAVVAAAAGAGAGAGSAPVAPGALAALVAAAPPAVAVPAAVAPPQVVAAAAQAVAVPQAAQGQGPAPLVLPMGSMIGLPAHAPADFQQLQQQMQDLPPEMKTASFMGFIAGIPMAPFGGDAGGAGELPVAAGSLTRIGFGTGGLQ